MRALVGIASYEVRRSWPVVAVAFAGALAARLVPWAMGDLVLVVGLVAGAICVARALALDLSSPRRAFVLARPVPAVAVWWGKVVAALALLAACVGATVAVLAGTGPAGNWRWANLLAATGGAAVLGTLAGMFFGGLASRSLAVVGALGVAIALLVWTPRLVAVPVPMAFYYRAQSPDLVTLVVVGVAVLVVLLAGAFATIRGRADGRQTASTFTAALCGALVPVLLVNGWWQWRVEGAHAARFSTVRDAFALPGADWVVITGGVRTGLEYEVDRLVHVRSGREYDARMTLAADEGGRSVAWLQNPTRFTRGGRPFVRAARLDEAGGISVRDLGVSPVGRPSAMALSPAGRWLAMSGGGHVVVTEVVTTKQAVRVPLGDVAQFPLLHFASDDRLIVARGPAGGTAEVVTLQLLEIDLRTRRIVVLADGLRIGRGSALASSPDASRLLVWKDGRSADAEPSSAGPHVFAVSAGSATRVWSHAPTRTLRVAAFLRDGRVAAVQAGDDGGMLRVFDVDAGTSLHVVPLPATPTGEPFFPWRIVELSSTTLAVEARRFPPETAATLIVNLGDGTVARLPGDYAALPCLTTVVRDAAASAVACNQGAAPEWLFRAPGPAIVARDSATGAMRPVFTMGR